MGHKVRKWHIQPQSSIAFAWFCPFLLAGGSPSILQVSRGRKGVCLHSGVLFMRAFLNCYCPLFCSSKRHTESTEWLLPKQAANLKLTSPAAPAALLMSALGTEQKTRGGREVPCLCCHQAAAHVHDACSPLTAGLPDCIHALSLQENNVTKQMRCLRQSWKHLEDSCLAGLSLLSHAWHTSAGGALAQQHSIQLLKEALIKIILLFEKKQCRHYLRKNKPQSWYRKTCN